MATIPTLGQAAQDALVTGTFPEKIEVYGCQVVLNRTTGNIRRICTAQDLALLINELAAELTRPAEPVSPPPSAATS